MINWFEIFADRLTAIEAGQREIRDLIAAPAPPDAEPFGDFTWLQNTCTGIPASTLRIKSAAGDIPGVVKFGKRVLYDKAAVLNWLRSQTRQPLPDADTLAVNADAQINAQLAKKGGKAQ